MLPAFVVLAEGILLVWTTPHLALVWDEGVV
jgi:hypothetical protein